MTTEQLQWFPCYIDRLITSQKWRLMKDYERGWYWSLIVESVRSERPGYLRFEENLWRLAGAQSKQFFDRENAVVLACFRSREIDGETWLYNERLLRTLEEQTAKFYRGRDKPKDYSSNSPSFSKEEESTSTPDLPAIQLAKGLAEGLHLVVTSQILMDIEAAIKCAASRQKCTLPLAHDYLVVCASRARERGVKINRFWFQDSDGWEMEPHDSHKTTAQLRNERSSSNLDRAFAEEESPRNLPADIRQGIERGRGKGMA